MQDSFMDAMDITLTFLLVDQSGILTSTSSAVQVTVLDTLEILRRRGLPQVILSATELEMLTGQLKTLGIYDYFDDVLGLDNIEAYSKVEIGVRWMQWARPVRALFVGDTEHDAETAASMGVDCVLIPNGHQSEETLKKCKNAVLLHDIRELPAYLDSVSE